MGMHLPCSYFQRRALFQIRPRSPCLFGCASAGRDPRVRVGVGARERGRPSVREGARGMDRANESARPACVICWRWPIVLRSYPWERTHSNPCRRGRCCKTTGRCRIGRGCTRGYNADCWLCACTVHPPRTPRIRWSRVRRHHAARRATQREAHGTGHLGHATSNGRDAAEPTASAVLLLKPILALREAARRRSSCSKTALRRSRDRMRDRGTFW